MRNLFFFVFSLLPCLTFTKMVENAFRFIWTVALIWCCCCCSTFSTSKTMAEKMNLMQTKKEPSKPTDSKILIIFQALYWAIITMTSVGYGDIYPTTWFGKLVGSGKKKIQMGLFERFLNTVMHTYFIWISQLALFVGYCVFPCQSPLLLTISTNSTKKPKSRKKSKPNGRKHHGKMPREVKMKTTILQENTFLCRVSPKQSKAKSLHFFLHFTPNIITHCKNTVTPKQSSLP